MVDSLCQYCVEHYLIGEVYLKNTTFHNLTGVDSNFVLYVKYSYTSDSGECQTRY